LDLGSVMYREWESLVGSLGLWVGMLVGGWDGGGGGVGVRVGGWGWGWG